MLLTLHLVWKLKATQLGDTPDGVINTNAGTVYHWHACEKLKVRDLSLHQPKWDVSGERVLIMVHCICLLPSTPKDFRGLKKRGKKCVWAKGGGFVFDSVFATWGFQKVTPAMALTLKSSHPAPIRTSRHSADFVLINYRTLLSLFGFVFKTLGISNT